MKKRTEVFIQFMLDGDRDDNLETADKVAQWIMDYCADAVSVKLEQVDGGN